MYTHTHNNRRQKVAQQLGKGVLSLRTRKEPIYSLQVFRIFIILGGALHPELSEPFATAAFVPQNLQTIRRRVHGETMSIAV